jgi:hypothetical protein
MAPTRRQFIRQLGIMLASLVASGCVPSCPAAAPVPGSGSSPPRERLRSCWLGLDWLAQQTQDNVSGDYERQTRAWDKILKKHRAALDELVAAGELDAGVADRVQAAFGEATHHVWRSNSGMTCYEPTPLDGMYMDTKHRLIDRAQRLDEISKNGAVDPCTIVRIQAAIEREIAFLTYPEQEIDAMYHEIVETTDDFDPPISAFDLPGDPATAEAARFLVELLSEESGFADLPAQVATCQPPPSPTPVPTLPWAWAESVPGLDLPRSYWLQFGWLAEETRVDPVSGEQKLYQLVVDHWRFFSVLWAAGYFSEMYPSAMWQVQIAFTIAAYFVWCSNAVETCSPSAQIDSAFTHAGRLVERVEELVGLAESVKEADPSSVADEQAQAQIAIEQDIAHIMEVPEAVWALTEEILAGAEIEYEFVSFDVFSGYGFEIPPGTTDAARIIVDMILFGGS